MESELTIIKSKKEYQREYYLKNKSKMIKMINDKQKERIYNKDVIIKDLNDGVRKCIRVSTAKLLNINKDKKTGIYY